MALYVGDLAPSVRLAELEQAFEAYGKCSVGLKIGYAFVRYERTRDAEEAIRNLSGACACACPAHSRR